jgi:hypothetical protein
MAEFEKDEFKFPDEENKGKPVEDKVDIEIEGEAGLEIEIEDDTPPEDRNRTPSDPEKVKQLEVEVDDLDKYSKEAKDKLIKMKRVWNDERRRAESAERERQAALDAAQRLLDENKRIKKMLESGEKEYKEAKKDSAKAQLKAAEKAYKEAYESGDAEKILKAQQSMMQAQLELDKAKKFKLPPLQKEEIAVQTQQQYQPVPKPDERVQKWQSENPWFGQDEEMTAAALGLHEKLKRQGVQIGSEEYYAKLDNTMRKRFPENFDEDVDLPEEPEEPKEKVKQKADTPKQKPATVVAPATRSTAPKRVRLTQSQVAIAKKLGLTPEQYVRELLKVEA